MRIQTLSMRIVRTECVRVLVLRLGGMNPSVGVSFCEIGIPCQKGKIQATTKVQVYLGG